MNIWNLLSGKVENRITAERPIVGSSPLPSELSLVPSDITRVPWHLVVLVLDLPNITEKIDIPLKEAARFLKLQSRFDLYFSFVTFNDPHGYTEYPDGHGGIAYDLHHTALPQKWIDLLPPCSSVMSLYKLNGRPPVHGGSTWSLPYGVLVKNKLRTYSAIPTDLDSIYNNDPYQGFLSHAGQICTHEIVNAIQGKLEAAPYYCGQLQATQGDPAWKYESDRIGSIHPECYTSLGKNED